MRHASLIRKSLQRCAARRTDVTYTVPATKKDIAIEASQGTSSCVQSAAG
jgi:hypothetical protein